MALNLEGDKVFPVKTCLSMFETYCSTQQKNCWQIQVLKNKMKSTINEYSSREKLKKTDVARPKSIVHRSQRPQIKRTLEQTIVEEKQGQKDMSLFGVFKLKIYGNERYNRVKTEYTVHRHNYKTYIKKRQVQEFNGKSFDIDGGMVKRKFQFDVKNTRDYLNKKPIESKTLKQIIVNLQRRPISTNDNRKKYTTTDVTLNNNRKEVLRPLARQNSEKNSRVIVYSKKYDSKNDNILVQNSNKQISGWQTREEDDCGTDGETYVQFSKKLQL